MELRVDFVLRVRQSVTFEKLELQNKHKRRPMMFVSDLLLFLLKIIRLLSAQVTLYPLFSLLPSVSFYQSLTLKKKKRKKRKKEPLSSSSVSLIDHCSALPYHPVYQQIRPSLRPDRQECNSLISPET